MLVNICDYDILKNERYTDSFLYTSLDRRCEADDSDIVAQILLAHEAGHRHAKKGDRKKQDDNQVDEEEEE